MWSWIDEILDAGAGISSGCIISTLSTPASDVSTLGLKLELAETRKYCINNVDL
jgi:hypothetical protein